SPPEPDLPLHGTRNLMRQPTAAVLLQGFVDLGRGRCHAATGDLLAIHGTAGTNKRRHTNHFLPSDSTADRMTDPPDAAHQTAAMLPPNRVTRAGRSTVPDSDRGLIRFGVRPGQSRCRLLIATEISPARRLSPPHLPLRSAASRRQRSH